MYEVIESGDEPTTLIGLGANLGLGYTIGPWSGGTDHQSVLTGFLYGTNSSGINIRVFSTQPLPDLTEEQITEWGAVSPVRTLELLVKFELASGAGGASMFTPYEQIAVPTHDLTDPNNAMVGGTTPIALDPVLQNERGTHGLTISNGLIVIPEGLWFVRITATIAPWYG